MNAGRVELDLVAIGKDQVSAMLKTIEGQVKKTAAEMDKAGTQAAGLGDKIGDLKQSVSPLNKVREGFENIRSNAFFVVGAVSGVVAAFASLSDSLSDNTKSIKAWEETQKNVASLLDRSRDTIEKIDVLLGKAPKTEIAKTADEALALWSEAKDAVEKARVGLVAYDDQLKDLKGTLLGEFGPAYQEVEKQRNKSQTDFNLLLAEQERLQGNFIALKERELALANTPYGPPLPENYDPNFSDPNALNMEPLDERRRRGGGGGSRPKAPAFDQEAFNREQQAKFDRWIREQEITAASRTNPDRAGLTSREGTGGKDGTEEATKRFRELGDAITYVGEATASVASDKFPEMFEALSEISAITAQVTEGKLGLTEALVQSGVAVAAATAKAIGGVRAEAAVRAAYEVGMGFATLSNPPISAGHFLAAGLLGAVAGGAGGGGGGGGGSSGGGSRGGSGGFGGGYEGPKTVINNFSTLVTDPHQVTRAISQTTRSTRGSGSDQRRGG